MKLLKSACGAFILVLFLVQSAYAGHFAEAFRRFVFGPEAEAYSLDPFGRKLDQLSTGCMKCHNGKKAVHITFREAGTPMEIRGSRTVNHPVGMRYDYYSMLRPGEYQPKSLLNPAIRLVDGRVTCLSCHALKEKKKTRSVMRAAGESLYAMNDCTASGELTVGPRETDLCMGCHIK